VPLLAVAEEWLQKQPTVSQKHLEFKLIVVMQTAFAVASPASDTDCNDFPALHLELRGCQNDVQTHQSRLWASHVDFFPICSNWILNSRFALQSSGHVLPDRGSPIQR